MDANPYAITDVFYLATLLEEDLSRAFGKQTPFKLFTDSSQIFDVITHGNHPPRKGYLLTYL